MRHIISDLHLSDQRPDLAALFNYYMQQLAPQADELYILGDFFEAWIGDDFSTPLVEQVRELLKAYTSQGKKLYLFHGNRDFLLGDAFASSVGASLIQQSLTIQHLGDSYLLSHGDEYCTDDTQYQEFKQMVRNPAWQQDFLAKPLQQRIAIAMQMREHSKQNQQMASQEIMDVNQEAVLNQLKSVDHLIHGHTHRPNRHQYSIDGQSKSRYVLSDWGNKGHFLALDNQGITSHYFDLDGVTE